MAKLLITGARAPVALELARNLHGHGHQVIMVDSLLYPLARNSKAINQFYKIPGPRENLEGFRKNLLLIIQQENVDYLIPTCEEIFYISFIKNELDRFCQIICPDFDLITKFHSKIEILNLCTNKGVGIPSTKIVDKSNLKEFSEIKNIIVKKEFCRFGTDVLLNPTRKMIKDAVDKNDGRILLQEKIVGVEYCTYAIVNNGTVYAEAIYEPSHRIRLAAGIYFKPIINDAISKFVKDFCKEYQFTGQIGFDVIVANDIVYVIECNPRTTSGVHLLQEADLFKAFIGRNIQEIKQSDKASMIGLVMLLIGIPIAIKKNKLSQWWSDYSSARDVINLKKDKSFMLFKFLSLGELLVISLRKKVSIRQASTMDIEWDGEEIK
ncbi:MAG: ATP-grasp domain-containing protein [Gammaproteobacteria bacterium]|nr:ATP-grasp domain-containing protein [Gammaproteobacteria bacterium]